MIIYSHDEYPQLGPAWWELRNGTPTASEASRIITAKDGRASKSQSGYARELCNEIILACPKYFTGKGAPINRYQEYGRDMEREARDHFPLGRDCDVMKVGMLKTDDLRFGCSPDFMICQNGNIVAGGEIKCPGMAKHSRFQLNPDEMPLEYKAQVHMCLAVSGLRYWQWRSYYPGLDPVDVRVEPDSFTMALRTQLELFWKMLQDMKKEMGITKEPEIETPETKAKISLWNERLAKVEGDVHDRQITEQAAVDLINLWLPELIAYEHATKRAVYQILKKWIDLRPVKWHFDAVNKVYRLEESVSF